MRPDVSLLTLKCALNSFSSEGYALKIEYLKEINLVLVARYEEKIMIFNNCLENCLILLSNFHTRLKNIYKSGPKQG